MATVPSCVKAIAIEERNTMNKPILSKQAFWDVDMESIDYEKNALFIIESVLNNGSIEDFRSIVKFYGAEKIRKTIINTKELGPKEVNFCCHVFEIKPQDFIYPVIKKNSPAQAPYHYGA